MPRLDDTAVAEGLQRREETAALAVLPEVSFFTRYRAVFP